MAENLKTTQYNDGTDIPLVTEVTEWINLNTPGYCWYDNDEATYKEIYGALYNWFAVNSGKLCPAGWHIPTDDEWKILTGNTGWESTTGGTLKETGTTHWMSPNTGATNETGFTALPGGYRHSSIGTYGQMSNTGYWWSSTQASGISAWNRELSAAGIYVLKYNYDNMYGLSVCFIKD